MESPIKKIVYRFEDASVPPQYHRSYTITVTPGIVDIVVDSYGDILVRKDFNIEEAQFDGIVKSLTANKIRREYLGEDKGCTGGTGEALSYWTEEGEIFSASVYHCGGKDSGDLAGNIKAVAADIKKMVPDLHELLK